MRGNHDCLHATGADLVDRGGIALLAKSSIESDLTCWGLADTRLHDVAHVDLLNLAWWYLAGLECMLKGDNTELGCCEGLESTVEGADGRPRCGDDHNFACRRLGLRVSGKKRTNNP